ncbi:MAG: hypothetical protein IJC09_05385 [Clostridia bacterium]|nr:hypothetical protein [Clostridia bacterium]
MSEKKTGKKLMLATAAIAAVYSVAAGKGPFNKYRFKKQHEELSKYVDTNYPECSYAPITVHGKGWASVILKAGKPVSYVYFTKSEDGTYIFTELDEQIK